MARLPQDQAAVLRCRYSSAPAQQSNYARSGFRLAYASVRYRGRAEAATLHGSVEPANAASFEAIADLDRRVFPERRESFLRRWLTQPTAGAYVAREGNRLTGYAVVRQCREGWKIAPLVADGPLIARRLYEAAAAHAPRGEAIFVDIPKANPDAEALLAPLGLAAVFETARMYTGPDPEVEMSRLFGVTTFELG